MASRMLLKIKFWKYDFADLEQGDQFREGRQRSATLPAGFEYHLVVAAPMHGADPLQSL
jgi:hypothetical protein